MYTAVYIEINLISCLVLLLILLRFRANNDRQAASIAYTRTAIAALVVLLLDIAWALTERRTGDIYVALNYCINVGYLAVSVLVSYFWLQFVLYRLQKSSSRNRKIELLHALPLAATCILCALSPWTRWMFFIDENNVYQRGPLLFVQQVVSYGYILSAGGYALLHALRDPVREKRDEARTLSSFVVLPVIGATIAILFYGLPIVWPLTTFSLLMVYLNLQSMQISTDELTGLNNRRQFDRYLLSQIEDPHRDERLYLLLIDIDAFKKINDTYGHLTGDDALAQAAAILKRVCGVWNCFLARYGGDEFAILCKAHDPTRIARLRNDLSDGFEQFNRSRLKPYQLTISVGVGAHSQDANSPAALIERADRALYEAKAEKRATR